ncbi:cysteine hydrolase family protein [Priestia koreensis]|uniref:cysteine hydrolase family protein n=1 Tax=Priestia koreensis TaxID=284581 RepID=UPI00301A2AA4
MDHSALIIIDVQVGMFLEENPVFEGEALLTKLEHLIEQARAVGMPIFYVQHNAGTGRLLERGTENWSIYPRIAPTDQEAIIHKRTPDAFYETTLHEKLKQRNIRHVILTGIQSEVCVDTTCRSAFSLGYDVTLVSDGHSTWDANGLSASQIIHHHNQTLTWFARLIEAENLSF